MLLAHDNIAVVAAPPRLRRRLWRQSQDVELFCDSSIHLVVHRGPVCVAHITLHEARRVTKFPAFGPQLCLRVEVVWILRIALEQLCQHANVQVLQTSELIVEKQLRLGMHGLTVGPVDVMNCVRVQHLVKSHENLEALLVRDTLCELRLHVLCGLDRFEADQVAKIEPAQRARQL